MIGLALLAFLGTFLLLTRLATELEIALARSSPADAAQLVPRAYVLTQNPPDAMAIVADLWLGVLAPPLAPADTRNGFGFVVCLLFAGLSAWIAAQVTYQSLIRTGPG